jgi:hypothetical protein
MDKNELEYRILKAAIRRAAHCRGVMCIGGPITLEGHIAVLCTLAGLDPYALDIAELRRMITAEEKPG